MSQTTETPKVPAGKGTARRIGGIAFAVGFFLAVVGGIVARDYGGIILALVILGIVAAVLYITAEEVVPFMVAAIALVIVGGANIFKPLDSMSAGLGQGFNGVINYLAIFMVSVAIISAARFRLFRHQK